MRCRSSPTVTRPCTSSRRSSSASVAWPSTTTRYRPGAIANAVTLCTAPRSLRSTAAARRVLRLRAAAVGRGEQPVPLDGRGLLVGLDGGGDERDPGVGVRHEAALGAGAVDPAGVGPLDRLVAGAGGGAARRVLLELAPGHLGLPEQLQDEALVRGAALDHDGGLRHGAAQAAERLVAGASVGDDLGDHRVEVGRDQVALAHAGVDADAGARGQVQPGDQPGGGREVAVGVLRVEARLDGVAELGGPLVERPAGGDVDLRLDQVELVGDLGDRVLHLQAGVDLEEREHLVARVVEELDGARAAIVDGERKPLGGGLQLVGLLAGQQRGGGLFDDLLVASLDGAVAHADGPRGALAVGDHLHLDVAGARDERLEEHHAGAERALGLVAGALIGVLELVGGGDLADAATAAARRRLQHQGVADALGGREGLVEGVDAPARPGRHRDAHLLGDELGADLVAQLAHRVAGGADERDAEALDEVGEGGVLGDEAPAHPDGVGPGIGEDAGEQIVVEVGTLGRRAQRVGLVGLPGEHGGALGVGIQRDRRDGVAVGVLGVEVPHRVDEPHGGLTAVDDGDALEHRAS